MSAPTRAELDERLRATADLGVETRGIMSGGEFARRTRASSASTAGVSITVEAKPTATEPRPPLVRKPERFSFERGTARAAWSDPDVELRFDLMRLDRRSGELSAELTVLSGPALLHRARINLAGTRTRSDLAKYLGQRMAGPDWLGLLESAAWQVIEAHRQGSPAFLLRDAQEPTAAGWAIKPVLLARDPVILFGDGGATKSYLALAFAVALQSGIAITDGLEPARPFRVAFLDFEWNAWPHHRRLRALCGPGELPDLLYVPCQTSGPLSHQVERLQRIFQDNHIDYVVIDSVGLATDGPPEEAASALSFFQALSRLEVGSALIAHVNRTADTSKPFGSAFWHNSARMTWFVKRERANGSSSVDVGLYNRKANDGAQQAKPIGLRFTFDESTTNIGRFDVSTSPQLEGQLTLKDRMATALAAGAMTAHELATDLGAPVNSITQTANRWEDRLFVKLTNTPDGVHRIGLATTGDSVT